MIDIQQISFGYNRKQLVFKDFSLTLSEGGIYGLLGKNGTGKSTLLYLMTGLLYAQRGSIRFKGQDVGLRLPETLQDMFLVPEEFDLPPVRLEQYIRMYAPFYPRFDEKQMRAYLQEFELSPDLKLSALSMGQKKKVYISFALATNVSLLLMDEPTNGLDIPSKSQFRKIIASSMTDERCIVISTHQVRDLDFLLDRLVIIDNDRLLLNTSIAHISEKLCFDEIRPGEQPQTVLASAPTINGCTVITHNTEGRETTVDLELLFNAVLDEQCHVRTILQECS